MTGNSKSAVQNPKNKSEVPAVAGEGRVSEPGTAGLGSTPARDGLRRITVKFDGICEKCGAELKKGEIAMYSPGKGIFCVSCVHEPTSHRRRRMDEPEIDIDLPDITPELADKVSTAEEETRWVANHIDLPRAKWTQEMFDSAPSGIAVGMLKHFTSRTKLKNTFWSKIYIKIFTAKNAPEVNVNVFDGQEIADRIDKISRLRENMFKSRGN